MEPLSVGTMAMLLVMAPSRAFRVAAKGRGSPSGHMVMNPKGPGGITVALNTKAFAVPGTPQDEAVTFTLRGALNGGVPDGNRLSNTRQGVMAYKDSPPGPCGAK